MTYHKNRVPQTMWSQVETDALIDMLKRGMTCTQISKQLVGRSFWSVHSKIERVLNNM